MKGFLLLAILIVSSMHTTNQSKLHILKEDYQKLFSDVREIARNAAFPNLSQIRNDLDYSQEEYFLISNTNS